jgi:hypothetical protein
LSAFFEQTEIQHADKQKNIDLSQANKIIFYIFIFFQNQYFIRYDTEKTAFIKAPKPEIICMNYKKKNVPKIWDIYRYKLNNLPLK